MKKILAVFAALAFAGAAGAAMLFDGSSNTVYKATTDNANVPLTQAGGVITLTDNSPSANISAAVFGNFNATTLSNVGDTLTISFRINNIPPSSNTPLNISLSGDRGVGVHNTDMGYSTFERSYAGFKVTQAIDTALNAVNFSRWNGGPAGNTTADRNILSGATNTAMGAYNTGTGVDRFDAVRTADITFSVVRASSTDFQLAYTLNVSGGTGLQSFTSSTYVPSGDNYFQLNNALTTFAVGFAGTMDNGSVLNLSNLQVQFIPEPGTLSFLLSASGLMLLGRKLRRG